jgi:2-polyprenyl-3-methyl-5-hydroxy-6-metoxy-1,4-benzoquinol methylase
LKALALYRDLPAAVRMHTQLRAFTCPMAAVVRRVPRAGSLLEVGCGHGLFANEAALENPELQVLGIDPAADKIRWACESVQGRERIRFQQGRLEGTSEDLFDAVAVLDVLYLVPRADWPAFLAGCRERLRPGGKLLLKEVDVRPRWKFYRCWLQESLSVRLFGITLGREFAFAGREEMLGLLRGAGFGAAEVTDLGRGYLTPHVLYEAVRS